MTPQQIEVINWVNAGCEYNLGVSLYQKYGKNRGLAGTFPGREKRYANKLCYELCKSVKLDWKNIPEISADIPTDEQLKNDTSLIDVIQRKFIPFTSDNKPGEYPAIIRKVINEYSELYKERARLHKQLTTVGEDNSPDNILKRKSLLDNILLVSKRMEILYVARKEWENNKTLPDGDALFGGQEEKPKTTLEKIADKLFSDKKKISLPDDINTLKKLKQKLQTNNSKDRNRLHYQSIKKGDKETPMPSGPKRIKIEKRMQLRDQDIEEINLKISKIAG